MKRGFFLSFLSFLLVCVSFLLLLFVGLGEESPSAQKDIDGYQKWLIEEVVMGKYKEAREGYLKVMVSSKSEEIARLCRFRAALCAEKMGDFKLAKKEYEEIVRICEDEEIVAAAKMGLLRLETTIWQKISISDRMKERLKEYKAIEEALEVASFEQLDNVIKDMGVSRFVSHYLGMKSFLRGVVAIRRANYEEGGKWFNAALKWLPDFCASGEMAKQCEASTEGKNEVINVSDAESVVLSYLTRLTDKDEGDGKTREVLRVMEQRELLGWLPDEIGTVFTSGRIQNLIKDVEQRFWKMVSENGEEEVERLDSERASFVKRLKVKVLKLLGEEVAEKEKEKAPVFWLRVLLLDKSLKELGVGEPLEVKQGEERSRFVYGVVDLEELKKSNPKVLMAVQWDLEKEKVEAKSAVRGLEEAGGGRLCGVSVKGFRVEGLKVKVVLELRWEKEGGRVLSEKAEHSLTALYGFAELFGGWLVGERRLYCSVEWGEK
ncbi:MAG: hypothetical protein N2234_07085 [Planctomycetota bacterium]|nr:hypothetical protein [Planctomycetota bacterium]